MRTCTLLFTALVAAPLLAACQQSAAAAMDDVGAPAIERARAVLVPVGDSGVHGSILLARTKDGLHVTGRIEGLAPGEHGFHVHEYGDLSDRETGASAGGHFAPHGAPHGRPSDAKRHVGDLGNVTAGEDGVAEVDLTDEVVALSGEDSVLGRAFVVHAQRDHFTQPTGDADGRVAFGVIGVARPPSQ